MATFRRALRANRCLSILNHKAVPCVHSKRFLLQWTNDHIIHPVREIAAYSLQHPLHLCAGIASIGLVSYGLREYGSRKIMYQPYTEFLPSWKSALKHLNYQEIHFENTFDDNIHLHGIYIPGTNRAFANYPLLFLHGNAGNISHRIDNLLLLHHHVGCDIFIFDYRGYGKSVPASPASTNQRTATQPTQQGLIEDAISAMQQLLILKNDSANEIKPVLFGHSLGGAVAFHSLQPIIEQQGWSIGGVIIENSFSSAWDVVGNNLLYPFIADKWDNMRCIDGLKRANLNEIPFLFISAKQDSILDPSMMQHLHDYCREDAEFKHVKWQQFEHADHNDTYESDGYCETLTDFFSYVLSVHQKLT